MIESIFLRSAPCFDAGGVTFGPLTKFNFVFGGNGSGKTTISRAIADPARYSGTTIVWDGTGHASSTRTYNLDFVRRTIGTAASDLPGVFLLGTASKEIHDEIARVERELGTLDGQLEGWTTTLGDANAGTGKLGEIKRLRAELADAGWNHRDVVPTDLQPMFDGYRNSKANFLERLLNEAGAHADVDYDFESLSVEAASVFDATAVKVEKLLRLALGEPNSIEGHELIAVPIVGSTSVALAPLIEELQNSDWVSAGRDYLPRTSGRCPFCQQSTPHDLAEQLSEYFDARYIEQIGRLAQFAESYGRTMSSAKAHLSDVEGRSLAQLDEAAFQLVRAQLELSLEQLSRQIQEKLDQPSLVFEIGSTDALVAAVNEVIDQANVRIQTHNDLVDNRDSAARVLVARAWRAFVRGTLAADVATYESRIAGQEAARESLTLKIGQARADIGEKRGRLRELQSQITSSKPIITDINKLLESVGFRSFHLAESSSVSDGYELVREDGTRVEDSLSEGERTFITFLYFYHQLQGVQVDSSESFDLVAVIDDPISSLDSDILFVVSTLVRRIMARIRAEEGRVRQLILLTHNVHFHKEVTYVRHGESKTDRSYFVVRKRAGQSSEVVPHGADNPVRTVYKSLWDEIGRAQRSPEMASIGLQNVMRRVLENYFRILGSIDDDTIVGYFEGEQQVICRSLFGWVNEGSHSIIEELDFSPTELSTAAFLEVFQLIFQRSGNQGHYDMMLAN